MGGKNNEVNKLVAPVGQKLDQWNPYVSAGRKRADQKKSIEAENGSRPTAAGFNSILTPEGKLGSNYQVAAGPEIKAKPIIGPGSIIPGTVTAGSVNADKITGGQLDMEKLKANPDALNALKERAMATGDSPWLKMQLQKQGLDETTARDQAGGQALSGSALARSQLGMKGGLSGGAAERIAMNAGRGLNATRQGIGRAGQMDRLNLGIADDQTKMQALSQIPGMDLAFAQQGIDMNKFNIGTTLDVDKTNAGNNLDASKFNTGLAYDASKTNVGNLLDASKVNKGMALDISKTNAANNLQSQIVNSGQTMQTNLANQNALLGGVSGLNNFNSDKYKTDMMDFGAGKQAAATAGGGGKK